MKKSRFKPGDVIHVPVAFPDPDGRANVLFSNKRCDLQRERTITQLSRGETTTIVSIVDEDKGPSKACVVAGNPPELKWMRLTCCVRLTEDQGRTFWHEVMHVKIIQDMRTQWTGEAWFGFAISVIAISIATFLAVALEHLVFAERRVDSCYVVWQSTTLPEAQGKYVIMGNVAWGDNKTLGASNTVEEANKLMKQICPVKP